MKVPLSWIKQFLPLTQTASEIALHLTNLGIEVEDIKGDQATFSGVVVGKVLFAEKHPNADRLRVAKVTDGIQEYQVVCGAPNCREGIIVAFAKEHAELTDTDGKKWKIKKSKIRDVESFGMLCSANELKLSEESEGIIELPLETPLGIDLASFILDPIFDLSFTPNLGHCQSILGLARELSASFNLDVQLPQATTDVKGHDKMSVEIERPELCPRFTCQIIKDIKIGPSPLWMQNRLTQCGLRPINNVVDVSNYVMLELGHPLHIFDLDRITGSKMVIKQAESPFTFETLDHQKREIPAGTLLVCDEEKPLALAGIMGGLESAATDQTKNILIEAAIFAPSSIRKSSRLLGLKTDASSRFDRGVDEKAPLKALARATQLIHEICGGAVHTPVDHYPNPAKQKNIFLRPARVQELLGFPLSTGEMISLLKRLDMSATQEKENLHVSIPSYRNDINIEVDLIEEIARLYGYNHIPKVKPVYSAGTLSDSPLFTLEEEARTLLLREGLQECITCDLISPAENELTKEKEISDSATLRVLHPRSLDQSVLRTSLLPGLIKVAQHNFNFGQTDLALFEIGKIHYKEGQEIAEPSCIAILLSGLSRHPHFDRKPSSFDFFDLKGMIENFVHHIHLKNVQFAPSNLHTLHPWRQAQIKIEGTTIGVFGELHPQLILNSHLSGRILFAELNLNDILELKKEALKFHPLAEYPSSTRDWTLTLSTHLPYATIAQLIQSSKSRHLESFEMIDSYTSKELGPDRKNVTFRFVYRDRHQTIAYETVEDEHRQLTHSVAEKVANLI
jgi:phenylalanyl-tRNA synthetase beta chain